MATSTAELQTALSSGFTEIVDVATTFISANIGLVIGVIATLVVFSWFVGWLFGAFRRR